MSVDVKTYLPGSTERPAILRQRLGRLPWDHLDVIGNIEYLARRLLGLFCSSQCPGSVILDMFDLAREIRNSDLTVVGGFHSPMEKECLELLLRGPSPVVVCAGRSIRKIRLPKPWKESLDAGRMLLISSFGETQRRVTSESALQRNRLVAELADEVFIAHAAKGSKTEVLCREVLEMGKPILTIDRPENQTLLALGGEPVRPSQAATRWPPMQTAPAGKHGIGKP